MKELEQMLNQMESMLEMAKKVQLQQEQQFNVEISNLREKDPKKADELVKTFESLKSSTTENEVLSKIKEIQKQCQ